MTDIPMIDNTADFSKLRPYIADDKQDGPATALVIKGFSGPDEIQAFMDALLLAGVLRPKAELKQ